MPNRRNSLYLATILALLAGLATGRATFFAIAYLLLGLLLVSGIWAAVGIYGVTIGRSTRSRRSQVGRNFSETFYVRNTTFLPKLWLQINDFSDLPFHRASRVTAMIPARSTYTWTTDTPCYVRGEFRLGPMQVTTGDPFGLFEPQRTINATEHIMIYPQAVPLDNFALPAGSLTGGDPQRFITQHVTTNAASVREYVAGDSMNRMHWKSTARRGKLIVKEFELDPQVDIWLFVDFSRQSLVEDPALQRLGSVGSIMYGTPAIPRSTEEYAVVIAASLTAHFNGQQRTLGFSAYTPHHETYQPEKGQRQLSRILNTLAVARSSTQIPLDEMLRLEAHSFNRGTTLIIVTASLNAQWLMQVQQLMQRGIKPVCIFIDPTSFGGAYASDEMRAKLMALKIPTLIVNYGDDLSYQLSQRYL